MKQQEGNVVIGLIRIVALNLRSMAHMLRRTILIYALLNLLQACNTRQELRRYEQDILVEQNKQKDANLLICDTLLHTITSEPKAFCSPLIPMVFVEGNTYIQTGTTAERADEETNQTERRLSSFYIGKYEVTQAQWKQVMDTNPSEFEGDKLPVDHVSWLEAVEFCNRLSEREGLAPAYRISPGRVSCNFQAEGYRLPTEAEWEFAARGGSKSQGYAYSGGNDLDQVAWWLENSDRKSHPVGQKQPNELGLHDMTGNVWEWCWEWYDASHSSHAIRGGSWYSFPSYEQDGCSVQYRYLYYEPETWTAVIPVGIRLCRTK